MTNNTAKPLPISRQAVSLAHAIESQCRAPGQYQITLTVSPHGREGFSAVISRIEPMREMKPQRKGS